MGDSKAVSIRIPDELLAKIDKLAEEKHKTIKGKPNRSLVIQNAIVAYFDTVSDNVISSDAITVSDIVSIVDFRQLQDFVATLSGEILQVKKLIAESLPVDVLPDPVAKNETKQEIKHQLELSPLSTVSDTVDKGLTGKELSMHLGCKYTLLNSNKNKWKENPQKFIDWSASLDPNGYGWKSVEGEKKHALRYHCIGNPTSLSEGEAEAQSSHPQGLAF